jgi:AmmeMemoRadiSam system protein B
MASLAGYSRGASHAGSWYSASGAALDAQLGGWLGAAETDSVAGMNAGGAAPRVAAVIAPHAGYSYSGPCAAFAYAAVQPRAVERVFVLGPSHHFFLDTCALPSAARLETPLGALEVDLATVAELRAKAPAMFAAMTREQDEEEHSIELHLPYVARVLQGQRFKVVPVLVGSLDDAAERRVGQLLAPYLEDPKTLFVVSSDFCHWGQRFRFTARDAEGGDIASSIERLDRRAMRIIESKDARAFQAYLRETRNTICGRHPITVLLCALQASSRAFDVRFTHYAQSSRCAAPHDSSVSYASAVVRDLST